MSSEQFENASGMIEVNRYRGMMSRRLASLLLLFFALAAVATAAAANRPTAPATSGTTLTGSTASLSALRGKPVFINVWSSW